MFIIIHLHGIAQCTRSTWNDRNLVNRGRFGLFGCNKCMSDLMIGNNQFFFIGKDTVFLLISRNNNFDTFFKVCLSCKFTSVTNCTKCCFIDNICKFRAGSSGSCLCNIIKSNSICNFNFLCMNFQNFFSTLQIRKFYRNTAVKTSRTEKCRIQWIRTVGCCQDYNTLRSIKSIHFCKELVQGLLSLVITACKTGTVTFLANCINFINKYNTRSLLICLFEKISYFRSTHTDKHFYEFRTGDWEKRNLRLTCNCFCKKCLTCTRWTHKQSSLRHRRTNLCIFLRIVQIINDFCKKILRLVFSCNIGEFNSCGRFYINLRIALSKRHCPTRTSAHRRHHLLTQPASDKDKDHDRNGIAQKKRHKDWWTFRKDFIHGHTRIQQTIDQIRIIHLDCLT